MEPSATSWYIADTLAPLTREGLPRTHETWPRLASQRGVESGGLTRDRQPKLLGLAELGDGHGHHAQSHDRHDAE